MPRVSVASIALITKPMGDHEFWLARWNERWAAYNFVGGHKDPSESFRQCIIREIIEELGFIELVDFEVAAAPIANCEFTAFSKNARVQTSYTMEVFTVAILRAAAYDQIEASQLNVWLSTKEIELGQTIKGETISETMSRILALLSNR